MSEETVVAGSSPAEVEDVFNGEQVSLAEFQKYRADGELPARFKPAEEAESASADASEQTTESEDEESESASESETEEEAQEQPQKGAEKRIKQLLAKIKELERKPEKQDVKTESSPAPVQPATRPKPTADDKNQDGTQKYSTYEDFVEELADWKAEQRLESEKRANADRAANAAMKAKLDDARTRYDDADEFIFPAAKEIYEAKIPNVVKEVFSQSDNYVDLCYVVGSDPDEMKKFIELANSDPRAAIGKVFEYERGIKEELSAARDDKGKFVSKEAPEPKKTSAPKPPSPVGGASSRAFDVSDESLSSEEWARKRNADLAKRR